MAEQYMSELVCSGCGHTGHVTWDGQGTGRQAVTMSEFIRQEPGSPPSFTCLKCGTAQQMI